jgi:hypothetical protein
MLHAIGGINLIDPYGFQDGIGAVLNPLGSEISPNLFVPPANLMVASQTFTNAAWVKTQTTASAPGFLAPDGSMTASKLSELAVNTGHYMVQAFTAAVGDYLAASIYFKADGSRYFGQLSIQDSTQSQAVGMGIWMSTDGVSIAGQDWGGEWGAALTYINGGGESAPNGYCRVWVVGRVLVGTSFRFRFEIEPPAHLGDTAKGLFIWGAQVEKGFSPSLYKPT